MSPAILYDPRLYVILFRMDVGLAKKAHAKGCSCSGPLDVANYPRKPRAPVDLGPEHSKRFSFCCRICRSRTTPASVRFVDGRIYLFSVVVVITALASGISRTRLNILRKTLGVDRRTLERWRSWWRELFPRVRGAFAPPLEESGAHSVVDRVTTVDELVEVLRSLSIRDAP